MTRLWDSRTATGTELCTRTLHSHPADLGAQTRLRNGRPGRLSPQVIPFPNGSDTGARAAFYQGQKNSLTSAISGAPGLGPLGDPALSAGTAVPVLAGRPAGRRGSRRYRPGSSTLSQVTQPSSFSNSLMSTTTGVKPRSARSPVVRGADAAISTRSPPSGTTWLPPSSSTGRADGNSPAGTSCGSSRYVPSGSAV